MACRLADFAAALDAQVGDHVFLTADSCVEVLEEALLKNGAPGIMNTDQNSQFTRSAFIGVLEQNKIQISMDGKGCW